MGAFFTLQKQPSQEYLDQTDSEVGRYSLDTNNSEFHLASIHPNA